MKFKMYSFETVNKILRIAKEFEEDIDIKCGRQIIDGRSYLGMASLIGNHAEAIILTDNEDTEERFFTRLREEGID